MAPAKLTAPTFRHSTDLPILLSVLSLIKHCLRIPVYIKINKGRKQGVKLSFLLVFMLILMITVGVLFSKKSLLTETRKDPDHLLTPDPTPSHVHNDLRCPVRTHEQTITPLNNTQHLLVMAYMDQRVKGWDVRIIGIFRKDSIQPLYCVFCCVTNWSNRSMAMIITHSDHFGFPFVTTDALCQIPPKCNASHVTLSQHTDNAPVIDQTFLPIENHGNNGEGVGFQFNFTVCISNLFGDYNNVLQFSQSLEMYRLLGVERVVVYNTSCGPELNRLLHSYSQEGLVELVQWPINQYLHPSEGWLHSQHGGDIHYYGQLTTLNDCVYRSMDRSQYVLLNDIDEIIVPYQSNSLTHLMEMLQMQHPQAGVFLIENHIFPNNQFEPSGRFQLPDWKAVPGINILEHIYREEPDRTIEHPYKMIVQPKAVERTSVHSVLQSFGETVKVPPDVCRMIHVRVPLQWKLTREQLHLDTRLWHFFKELIPNVNRALRRAGLLKAVG